MGLLVVGISHRTAPVGLREHLAIPAERIGAALDRLTASGEVKEAVVLSTCNRVEVYVQPVGDRDRAAHLLREFFARIYDSVDAAAALYRQDGLEAVAHLFRVAAGLDSMVIGESEILGQVKTAYTAARDRGTTGKITNVLFQRALFVGKQVRTRTNISEGASSVGSVAVHLAERIFGSLQDRRILLIGAGEMAEVAARHLISQKTGQISVINRTLEKAQALAASLGGTAGPMESLFDELLHADIVICSTSAERPVITFDVMQAIMKARRDRSLYFIDIAVPRNVDPAVHGIDNAFVYNIDDLRRIVEENLDRRREEVAEAEALVNTLSSEFYEWIRAALEGRTVALKHGIGRPSTEEARP